MFLIRINFYFQIDLIQLSQPMLANKTLFDEENRQDSHQPQSQNPQKKARQKFTILDDIEQLNEIINGPGANEQNQKAQEVLQKTYQYMKAAQNPVDNYIDSNNNKNRNAPKQSRKREENKDIKDNQHKENHNVLNQGRYDLAEQLKGIKGPRIIVAMRKIDLLKQPNNSEFYVRGLENLTLSEPCNDGTRAPTNSMREKQETLLFTKALQQTQRIKQAQMAQSQLKGFRQNPNQNNLKR